MNPLRLVFVVLFLLFCVAAQAARPALVVVLVIDGLPQEQVVKYRDLYGKGGFQRLLDEGAWFADAHHRHAVTLTAPGHATMLTGSYPYRNGIIANEWLDRNTFEPTYNTGDAHATYIGLEQWAIEGGGGLGPGVDPAPAGSRVRPLHRGGAALAAPVRRRRAQLPVHAADRPQDLLFAAPAHAVRRRNDAGFRARGDRGREPRPQPRRRARYPGRQPVHA